MGFPRRVFSLGRELAAVGAFDGNHRADLLADTLDAATEKLLNEGKSPARKLGSIDNRGSHAWIAIWWAQALAEQQDDAELAAAFANAAEQLAANAEQIERELIEVQGQPVDIGGYYRPDEAKVAAVMRPSATLNAIIDGLAQ